MSAPIHIPPTTPFESLTHYLSRTGFPSLQSLFLDNEGDDARIELNITDGNASIDVDSDDSDNTTVVMPTPRARPRTLSLENLPDSFDLDNINLDEASDEDEGSLGLISTTIGVLTVPSAQAQEDGRIEEEDDEEEGAWSDEDDDSSSGSESDISDDSDDEEGDGIAYALFRYEWMLGSMFVYGEEARASTGPENGQWHMLGSIYDSVRKPSDTYAAAMRIFSIIVRMTEEEEDDYRQGGLFEEVKELIWAGAMAWLELPDPEEEISLGLARFALMGQLTRLRIFDEDIVCRVVEEFGDQLHSGGRMRMLQSLIRYAGPLICTIATADALETVREACEARPSDLMMEWMYSKIKKDMLVYAYRILCIGQEYDGRLEMRELQETVKMLKEANILPTQYP